MGLCAIADFRQTKLQADERKFNLDSGLCTGRLTSTKQFVANTETKAKYDDQIFYARSDTEYRLRIVL